MVTPATNATNANNQTLLTESRAQSQIRVSRCARDSLIIFVSLAILGAYAAGMEIIKSDPTDWTGYILLSFSVGASLPFFIYQKDRMLNELEGGGVNPMAIRV